MPYNRQVPKKRQRIRNDMADMTRGGLFKTYGVIAPLLVLLFLVFSVASCTNPFAKKAEAPKAPKEPVKTTTTDAKTGRTLERIDEAQAQPGDIKVIDGVEYIYARNKRYMSTPDEPEYAWIRKDLYTPGLGEALLSIGKKEREEMEKRIAKLEADLKKKGLSAQVAYPPQMMFLPSGMGYLSTIPMVPFTYPSPKMKRRVIVLPISDETNYKAEGLGELATRRLASKLEGTGTIITVDPATLNLAGPISDPQTMKTLNENFGVQAIITGSLSDVYTTTSRTEGKEQRETSFAMSKLSLTVFNTETGQLIKQLSGRNPMTLSRERGDLSSEKAKIKAIDLTIEVVSEDLLKSILSLDWQARVASVEDGKVFINAGRLSNLAKGDLLEVYAFGEEKIDVKTKQSLGRTRGPFKGDIEVVELFGVDACWAKTRKGTQFAPSDQVFLKK
jgi:hypothetical protein